MASLAGAPFHGEFTSADASALTETNSRFTLYGAGSVSSITLGANDQVVVTDVICSAAGTMTVQIYDGANATVDAGETVINLKLAANSNFTPNCTIPHYCQAGTYPKMKTSASGQVDAVIHGVILRQNS